jgi:hypothetical protein
MSEAELKERELPKNCCRLALGFSQTSAGVDEGLTCLESVLADVKSVYVAIVHPWNGPRGIPEGIRDLAQFPGKTYVGMWDNRVGELIRVCGAERYFVWETASMISQPPEFTRRRTVEGRLIAFVGDASVLAHIEHDGASLEFIGSWPPVSRLLQLAMC